MSNKKKILFVVLGVEAIVIAACIAFVLYINSDTVKVSRKMEQAQRYLLEEDYEQAIAVFETIIEIDPENVEAYIGLAEAYAETDDLEKSVKVLKNGSRRTDSKQIRKLLDEQTEELAQREGSTETADTERTGSFFQSFLPSSDIPASAPAAAPAEPAPAEPAAAAWEMPWEPVETTAAAPAESPAAYDYPVTIGFAQVGHESDWRMASTNSFRTVFSEENGYDLQFVDCDNDSAVQIEAVRGFIEQDVDYIVIDPIVSTGWDTVLTECEDAGIPVIVIDRTIDDSDKYVSWIGSNFWTEGLAAGEWLKAYANAKGIWDINVLVIEGTTGASATIGRTYGFEEIAYREGWTILDSQSGDFTQAGGQEVMESYCRSYGGQFNVVVCQNDNEAFGAMDAMDWMGYSYGVDGDVILISFDACMTALEYVLSGDINADFECNPLAAPFVEEVINTLEAGRRPDKEIYITEHCYVNENIFSSIMVNGKRQNVTVVNQAIIDAQY